MSKTISRWSLLGNSFDSYSIKVLHFTGETKPWNFYYSGHKDWEKNSEMRSYYAWVKVRREIQASIVLSFVYDFRWREFLAKS